MSTVQLTQPSDLQAQQAHSADVHRVQFYNDEAFLVTSVARHLSASLRSGGSAIVLATKDHRAQILQELAKLEIPAQALIERFVALEASEALSRFMNGDRPDPIRFKAVITDLLQSAQKSSSSGVSPLSAFGEMVAVLWAEGKREAAVQLEQLWSDFTRNSKLSLLCAYPLAYFSRSEDRSLCSRICEEHTSVGPAEGFETLAAEDRRAREIADLQQRAQALALEVEARKIAEEKLRATHAELEHLVEQRTSALRKLSLQVLKLQDLERRRIARELHDSLGQEFVALRVNLDIAKRLPNDPEAWKQIWRGGQTAEPLSVPLVPEVVLQAVCSLGALIAGLVLILSAYWLSWKIGVTVLLAAAVMVVGPVTGLVPQVWVFTPALLCLAAGGVLALLGFLFGRDT